ncbi:MAG: hypothetical protein FWD94_01155 [Treponema sp.]|nr:hypothetical protein [Treponema sp.]
MKKMVFFMVLATLATGMLAAQEASWRFGGALYTGLRTEFFPSGHWKWFDLAKEIDDPDDTGDPPAKIPNPNYGNPNPYTGTPTLVLWHMDEENRVRFWAEYQYGNLGIAGNFDFWFARADGNQYALEAPNLFGWVSLLENRIRISAGRIDRPVWQAPGAEDFNYSKGTGARFEFRPIDGLNVGFFLRPYLLDRSGEFPKKPEDNLPEGGKGGNNYSNLRTDIVSALRETSFGLRYDNDQIGVGAGFHFSSRTTGMRNLDGGTPYPFSFNYIVDKEPWNMPGVNLPGNGDTSDKDREGATSGYFGIQLKTVPNFNAGAGVQFANLGAFDEYGWIWSSQAFSYFFPAADMTVGLNMHQRHWHHKTLRGNMNYEFAPWVGGWLVPGKLWGDVGFPVHFWVDVVDFMVEATPNLVWNINGRMEFRLSPKISIIKPNKDQKLFFGGVPAVSDTIWSTGYVQGNFVVRF